MCDKCDDDNSVSVAPVCLDENNYEDPVTVTLTKNRFFNLYSAMIYSINHSSMPLNDRLEWAIVLRGFAEQAEIICPHEKGFHEARGDKKGP